jgi:hypothetical protein
VRAFQPSDAAKEVSTILRGAPSGRLDVAPGQQEISEIGAVLSGDAGDESYSI